MSREKVPLGPRYSASPSKHTHLHVTRKLSRGGEERESDEYVNEYYDQRERRGSSQSLSRYNSCPHLADKDGKGIEEQFESTADDINTNRNVVNRDLKCINTLPAPLISKRLYLENDQISATPTPPSTPRSRRSIVSSRDSLLSSPDKTFTHSPFSSPRLLLRKQMIQSALSRESSVESNQDKTSPVDTALKVPLSMENLHTFDKNTNKHEEPVAGHDLVCGHNHSTHPYRGKLGHSDQREVPESVNKCESWLQTLHIAQNDRIKSRSHIQLPPI